MASPETLPPNTHHKDKLDCDPRKKIKHLIVLCDGTGQSSSRASTGFTFPTNVQNFGDCLEQSFKKPKENGKGGEREVEQIVFYQSGIGTSSGTMVSQALASGVAWGIQDIILDAYYFLCNNYQPGDEIFIFGFSRGAFIARILADLVVRMGILHLNVSWMIRSAWRQYMKNDEGESFRFFLKKLHSENKELTQRVRVKILGVWDTVAAVGLNSSCQQFDTQLRWGIENVFHALALDEIRYTFGPTLFYLPTESKPDWLTELDAEETRIEKKKTKIDTKLPNLKQCWFAGAHTDIGGGYVSSHQSNITLAWMIDNCKNMLGFNCKAGNLDDWTKGDNARKARKWKKILNGHHRPEDAKYGLEFKGCREKGFLEDKYPGWGCGIIRDSYAEFHWGARWQYRRPGNYATPNKHPGSWGISHIPLTPVTTVTRYLASGFSSNKGTCTHPECRAAESTNGAIQQQQHKVGATNETIHQSVYARWAAAQLAREKEPAGLTKRVTTYICDTYLVRKLRAYFNAETVAQGKESSDWLANWNPKSLEGLRYESEDKSADGKAGWVGTCAISGKEFRIQEEPAKNWPKDGLMQALANHEVWKTRETSPLGGVGSNEWTTWWLEHNFDYSEYLARGKKNYVIEASKELNPRPFYQRWLGLGKTPAEIKKD